MRPSLRWYVRLFLNGFKLRSFHESDYLQGQDQDLYKGIIGNSIQAYKTYSTILILERGQLHTNSQCTNACRAPLSPQHNRQPHVVSLPPGVDSSALLQQQDAPMTHKCHFGFQRRGSSLATGEYAPVIVTGYRSIQAEAAVMMTTHVIVRDLWLVQVYQVDRLAYSFTPLYTAQNVLSSSLCPENIF